MSTGRVACLPKGITREDAADAIAVRRGSAADVRARNEWAEYAMARLALAASFREALYCGREAITHGVPADVVFDALEAWVRAVTA